MFLFRHDAGPVVHDYLIGANTTFGITPVETAALPLATLHAWTASVIDFPRQNESRGSQRQKDYSDTPGKLHRSATVQLMGAVCQFAEYWHPK